VLARLLKTDPNTLLCFQENMSDREITLFTNEVTEKIRTGTFAEAFSLAMEKLREYPRCARLRHTLAMVLDGALMMADLPESEKEPYRAKITALYEDVAQSDDPALANRARYMLASKYLQQGDYAHVQEQLDRMPAAEVPDKRTLQADLYAKQGRTAEAAALLERLVLTQLSETLMNVTKLVPLFEKEGRTRQAEQLAKAAQTQQEAYGLWQYSAYLAPLELAAARKDAAESLRILSRMLDAVIAPGNLSDSPLYCHQPRRETPEAMTKQLLPPLLADLQTNPDYAFLRDDPGLARLIADCKARAGIA
jgi:tetratricopeptide (TPR) repeat protein